MFIDIYQQFDSTAHTAHTTDLYFYAALTQLEMAAEMDFLCIMQEDVRKNTVTNIEADSMMIFLCDVNLCA